MKRNIKCCGTISGNKIKINSFEMKINNKIVYTNTDFPLLRDNIKSLAKKNIMNFKFFMILASRLVGCMLPKLLSHTIN